MSNPTIFQISIETPKTIEKRLSQLSSSEEIFNESARFYEDKLQQSGYQRKLKNNPANTEIHNKRNQKGKYISEHNHNRLSPQAVC